jgi:hypothetical protein
MPATQQHTNEDTPISELLKRAGYGHRRGADGGRAHQIYRLSDGVEIGWMEAGAAARFALDHLNA